jgi:hypothetical protein
MGLLKKEGKMAGQTDRTIQKIKCLSTFGFKWF